MISLKRGPESLKWTVSLSLVFLTPAIGVGFDACFDQAGQVYDISPELLRIIAQEESRFNPIAINKNANGTYDYGLMQINSSWERTLGRDRWLALGDPCYNIRIGAWVLRQCINRYGYTWDAVGCYNAADKSKRDKYARKIAYALKRKKTD